MGLAAAAAEEEEEKDLLAQSMRMGRCRDRQTGQGGLLAYIPVIHYHSVRCLQVEANTTSTQTQQENEDIRACKDKMLLLHVSYDIRFVVPVLHRCCCCCFTVLPHLVH
jgi:hypothetical protein